MEWLWQGRIPFGALTILDGHPDTGKSTITLDLAARLSTGRRMPDGSLGAQGATLLLSTEDTLARPVRARLEAAGADLEQVYGLEVAESTYGRPLSFPDDWRLLEEAVGVTGASLVVIDPIMGHLASDVNSNADQEVRRALNPLARLAQKTGSAILLVRHRKAPEPGRSRTRVSFLDGGGSKGGFGIVRSGLMAVRDDDDVTRCTLFHTKSNWGNRQRPIDYTWENATGLPAARIHWLP